ncbi:MAG: beta-glucosidase BglX [Bacteroidaceae bacterium]|nr:beta-glucosidase BglX [Bacteroidaceae bacterium]
MWRRIVLTIAVVAVGLGSEARDKKMDAFIGKLMSKMTLSEKIGQLNLQPGGDVSTGGAMDTELSGLIARGELGAVLNTVGRDKIRAMQQIAVEKTRLGIPLLVGLDVIHGYQTIFPIPLAQSCSWNPAAIEQGARIAAEEATSDGIDWTYSPMVDIALDARWGRIAEGNGEDPYLGGLIAQALVRGYQDDFSSVHNLMACLKHYALYGAVEAGRDYNTVDMSHLRMFNQYFPPYKAAVEAGVGSVMTSFNLVDGQHATANRWLLDDVLRRSWGFGGFIVTDYSSIAEMTSHGFGDLKHNTELAMKAGTDMDMCARGYVQHLEALVKEGKISKKMVDDACRRVLEAKYMVGLFDDPYRHCNMSDAEQAQHLFTAAHRQVARDFTAETFVLLKNEGQLLPLRKDATIALIGPNGDTTDGLLGTWCVSRPKSDAYPTLRQAMEQAVEGRGKVLFAQGCNIAPYGRMRQAGASWYIPEVDSEKAHREAMEAAAKADVIVCAMGEGADYSGESHSRVTLDLPETQMTLLRDLATLGKPIVLLNFAGRPTVMSWEKAHIPAIMNVWFGGTEMGPALCDVLFGDKSPSGHLTVSLPQHVGQEPLYYNHLNTGRPTADYDPKFRNYSSNYFEVTNGPAWPFGFGLSYTTFRYGDLQVEQQGRTVKATVSLTNTGEREGTEVVQCYIRDIACRYSRPVKELKGFERVTLRKGETKQVTITLDEASLSYYDMQGHLFFEPGEFDIMVGGNSQDVQTKRISVE